MTPAKVAGRVAAGIAREVTGGSQEAPPPPPAAAPAVKPRTAARPKAPPKDLDDVTIAHKVESAIFRNRKVAKGKVDVNVAEGVVWLRGEVKTPELVKSVEATARAVPEVRGVENLLHLPKTPAPTRTDTPPTQRKTRRTKPNQAARKVTPRAVTDEAPDPPQAEPAPNKVTGGRKPAPLGSKGGGEAGGTTTEPQGGPDAADLDKDPAYNPTDPALRDLKGG
jgi:hypothetical protein